MTMINKLFQITESWVGEIHCYMFQNQAPKHLVIPLYFWKP